MLYFIPTPIGNIEDITLRWKRLLEETDVLICEDTRSTKKLLNHLGIEYKQKTFHPLTSFTKQHQLDHYLTLLADNDVCMMSDAGTPGLSDPGKILIKICTENNVSFTVLPWANALVPAVVWSGFDTSDFRFVWFLPKKKGKQTLIKEIIQSPIPVFFYESVHRAEKTLKKFEELWFTGKVSIARELSKLHEQLVTGDIEEIIVYFESNKIVSKGEFVIGVMPQNPN